jgi:hypothetical protein
MNRKRARQRGEGRAGLFVAVIIVAFATYGAVKFVPVYVGAYDLRETIRDEVYRGSLKTNEQILKTILGKGQESGLPITRKDIRVKRTHAKIIIEVEFDTPIDMALFEYSHRFRQKESAPLF